MLTLIAGRQTGPAANSAINVGVSPQGSDVGRIIFIGDGMLANTAGQRNTSSMAIINANSKYECKTFAPAGGAPNLGNCDIFNLQITKIL